MIFDLLLPTSGLDVRCSTVRDSECEVGGSPLELRGHQEMGLVPGGGGGRGTGGLVFPTAYFPPQSTFFSDLFHSVQHIFGSFTVVMLY
jgi:hypothetical protein